ncbi:MAG: OadG family protein [Gammaproteobacteria bacterium]|nr:OadG family protein [Gammaproteobacteria bacterium]MDP6732526.1 OadG family protein [Gammaproteobacteria bacterium]
MENLVGQGIELALFGMGTVFVFLALLILATHLMSSVLLKFQPEDGPLTVDAVTQSNHSVLIAVITAAIAQHRKINE